MIPQIEKVHDEAAIHQRVRALGRRIDAELAADDPLVLSLIGGSLILLADLLRAVSRPLRYELIHVEYGAPQRDETLQIHFPVPIDVSGQNLLLLKDVTSTGVIETYLASELRERGARSVRFAALIDVPSERKTEFAVDYPLFTEERQGAFVGYGLKRDGRYGNLPYLGRIQDKR
jgi:hypoxanthine phosphoribosyltransferase